MTRLMIFLSVFLAVYGAMHILAYLGLRPILEPRKRFRRLTLAFMALMIAAPVLVRALERVGLEIGARLLAIIGYSWMAFIFLAFSGFVAIFAWDLLISPLTRFHPALNDWKLHGPRCALLVPGLALLLSLYGVFEAQRLTVETLLISTDKLPADAQPLRIVQISDLHLGLIHRHAKLEQVVKRIEALQPDLLVATGDIVDARLDHLQGLAEIFQRVAPRLGKYAIIGNHELYAGLAQALTFLEKSGFTLLRNQAVRVGPLLLVGVDDPASGSAVDEASLVQPAERCYFTLLLKHRPLVSPGEEVFDLQLSGHTHRGQIVPFNLVTALEYPRQNGLYRLTTGAQLYASRGAGSWGPPIRVFAPPEITLIELRPRPAAVR
jgi:predicted MPP superfamily phosphohydrolase